MANLLKFVEKSDPILREVMPEERDFSDPVLKKLISDMKYSILPKQLAKAGAAHKSAAGMAANQWGIRRRVFIFTPNGSNSDKAAEIMINPSYIPCLRPNETEAEMEEAYEGCFSVPLTTGIVRRYAAIIATWHNEAGEKVECIMEGWEARVFQHETDHLNGKLFDGALDNFTGPVCHNRILFKNTKEMDTFWKTGKYDKQDNLSSK